MGNPDPAGAVPPVDDWTTDWDHHDGASLWHLATHPDDRHALAADPIGGTLVDAGDTVMMAFPAACRDPRVFEGADEVDITRERNRHVAFGAGVHRCLGSNLARLELDVGIGTWLRRIPEFELAAGVDVTWAEGAIRGPRSVTVSIDRIIERTVAS